MKSAPRRFACLSKCDLFFDTFAVKWDTAPKSYTSQAHFVESLTILEPVAFHFPRPVKEGDRFVTLEFQQLNVSGIPTGRPNIEIDFNNLTELIVHKHIDLCFLRCELLKPSPDAKDKVLSEIRDGLTTYLDEKRELDSHYLSHLINRLNSVLPQ